MGDLLLAKLPESKRNIILWFVDAHRHDKNATELMKMQFVNQAMSIVGDTCLTNAEKKTLVMYMYQTLAANNSGGIRLGCLQGKIQLDDQETRIFIKCIVLCQRLGGN